MQTSHEVLEGLSNEWTGFKTKYHDDFRSVHDRIDELELREQRKTLEGHPIVRGNGPFLTVEQKAAPHFKVASPDYRPENVRVGAVLAALAGGRPVIEQLNDDERKSFNELTEAAGDYLVPSAIGSMFLDAVRPQTRILQAGALTYAMEAPTVSLPGWDVPPEASWRAEGDPFAASGGSFRAVVLNAQMVHCFAEVSIELLEDAANNLPGVATIIENELSRAVAQAIDYAALAGTGTGEPKGLLHAITPSHLSGAPADYDFLVSAYYDVAGGNFTPTAAIYSARTAGQLALLKTGLSGDKTQLQVPQPLAGLSRLVTNAVPDDLGQAENQSVAFMGDWSRLCIGFRPDMTVRVLRDPYTGMQAAGMVRFYVWQRADVAILDEHAFALVDQIEPTAAPAGP